MSTPRIAFIGAGNMATSLIGGLRAQGVGASSLCASDPGADKRAELNATHGIDTFSSNAEAVTGADVVVLAVKPQVIDRVLDATYVYNADDMRPAAPASATTPGCTAATGFCARRRR